MKKGDLFIATHEEYSDYGILGTFQVVQDLNLDVELSFWRKAHREQGFRRDEFLSQLDDGKIRHVTIPEIHFGSYSDYPENKLEPEKK